MVLSHVERAARRREMAALVKSGKTWAEVAELFDVSLATVGHACQEAGMVATRGGKFNSYAIIADLCNTSGTLAAIAVAHGKHLSDISSVYRKCIGYGIPVKKRKQGRPIVQSSRTSLGT